VYGYVIFLALERNGKHAMAFIPVPNTIQAELVYVWNGETCENVLHYEATGAPDLAEMTALAAALATWWNTNIRTIVSNQLSLTNIKITDLNFANAPGIDYSVGMPMIGAVANDSMPNNVSLSIAKRTVFRGRSFRGRIYHAGLAETQVAGNDVLLATGNSILAAWELAKTFTAAGETFTMVVVSKYSGGAERAEGLTTPVTNFTTDRKVDSQRRRLPGRGT